MLIDVKLKLLVLVNTQASTLASKNLIKTNFAEKDTVKVFEKRLVIYGKYKTRNY